MPLNQKRFRQFVGELRSQDEFSIATKDVMARQVVQLADFVKQTAIMPMQSLEAVPRLSGDDYHQYKRSEFEPRSVRARLMRDLDHLRDAMLGQTEKSYSIGYAMVRTREMAEEALEKLSPYDVDPQNVMSFVESQEGQQALKLAAREARELHPRFFRDFRNFRVVMRNEIGRARSENFYQHIAREAVDEKRQPLALNNRDLLVLMSDFLEYDSFTRPEDIPTMPARMVEFVRMLKDTHGCSLPQGEPLYTQNFWAGLVSNGLEASLNSFSDLTDVSFARDELTPSEVLRQLDGTRGPAWHRDGITIEYIDDATENDLGTLGTEDQGNRVFVLRNGKGSDPFIVQQMYPGIPSTLVVTAKDKNQKVLDVDGLDNPSASHILKSLIAASSSLEAVVKHAVVEEKLKYLKSEFRELDPLSDTLPENRARMAEQLRDLAKLVPPPGLGDLLDLSNRREIATIGIMLGVEQLGLQFQVPHYINNKTDDYKPTYELSRVETGRWEHNVTLTPILFDGFEVVRAKDPLVAMEPQEGTIEAKQIPDEEMSERLGVLMGENGITEVARPIHDGFCTFKIDDKNEFRNTGFWCSPKAKEDLTRFSVSDLASETNRGERVFNHMRNPEYVGELIADITAKFYGAHEEMGGDEYNEAIVNLHEDGFLDLPSMDTAISISSLALRTLIPEELTPFLSKKVGLTSLSDAEKKFVLDTFERTSWKQAESMVEETANNTQVSPSL